MVGTMPGPVRPGRMTPGVPGGRLGVGPGTVPPVVGPAGALVGPPVVGPPGGAGPPVVGPGAPGNRGIGVPTPGATGVLVAGRFVTAGVPVTVAVPVAVVPEAGVGNVGWNANGEPVN